MGFNYIIGDIHGEADLLVKLLSYILPHFTTKDKIIFLGDYIDRGNKSKDVIDILIKLSKKYPNQIIFLKGNHEQWFLEVHKNYSKFHWILSMEGLSTIESYSKDAAFRIKEAIKKFGKELILPSNKNSRPKLPYEAFFKIMPKEHIDFFYNLKLFYEDTRIICVHAGLNLNKTILKEQNENDILWANTLEIIEKWKGPKTLVVGHMSTDKIKGGKLGEIFISKDVICVDTGCPQSKSLGCIRLPDYKTFLAKY